MENTVLDTMLKALVDHISEAVVKRLQEGDLTKVLQRSLDHDEDFWHRVSNFVNEKLESTANPTGDTEFGQAMDKRIEDWADTYFEDKVGDWADSYLSDRIDTWMTDNFSFSDYGDIEDKIKDVIRDDISFDIRVS